MAFEPAGTSAPSTDHPLEREALNRVLGSGIFDRAPNLALILRYVCERYFDGRLDEIKEYNIAIDALGRSHDFDPKRDSIVRVEAYRLRKRLADYYANAGATDAVVIRIPSGTYVPHFVKTETAVVLAPAATVDISATVQQEKEEVPASLPVLSNSVLLTKPIWRYPTRTWASALVITLLIPAMVYAYLRIVGTAPQTANPTRARLAEPASIPASPSEGLRILVGSPRHHLADHAGDVWTAERYVTGGELRDATPRPIARTLDPAIYLRRREGAFQYDIPAASGTYELRLHFAEPVFGEGNVAGGGESSRVFGVRVNGNPQPVILDVVGAAGSPNSAYVRVFKDVTPASDGKVHVEFFSYSQGQPFLNALELLPSSPGRISPIRLLPRTTAVTDAQKRQWSPDACVEGGQLVQRHEPVDGAGLDSSLFQSERYGNFTYYIPVEPRSHYTVTLRFAESWFGSGRPGGGGVGSRVFDVYSGGRTLLKRFDVLKEVGASLRAVSKTFQGLEPTSGGLLVLHFVPIENYAFVNSIEVLDEGR